MDVCYGKTQEMLVATVDDDQLNSRGERPFPASPFPPAPPFSPAGMAKLLLEPFFIRGTEVGNYREPLPLKDLTKRQCESLIQNLGQIRYSLNATFQFPFCSSQLSELIEIKRYKENMLPVRLDHCLNWDRKRSRKYKKELALNELTEHESQCKNEDLAICVARYKRIRSYLKLHPNNFTDDGLVELEQEMKKTIRCMEKYNSKMNNKLLEGCVYDRYIFKPNVWNTNKASWKAFLGGCLINYNFQQYRCSYPFVYESDVCDKRNYKKKFKKHFDCVREVREQMGGPQNCGYYDDKFEKFLNKKTRERCSVRRQFQKQIEESKKPCSSPHYKVQ
ncbi:DgyrCDS5613 [Dimorphilus gyrociliatus]|uniref:DgyrCDS5613 n=1 Tax=Dimorphilus gyrociliatus TaxID=2664684 RepID=A0A7I8VKE6_9ANNE|nr:DgyrCDS5613 [Dimorphilus gyrociliatus]